MKILLTLDFELFNGNKSGTINNCLITPTEELLKVLDKHNFKATFFVDTCFLNRLKKQIPQNPELQSDWDAVMNQLSRLSSEGHDLQLHLHPNWYNATYENNTWHSIVDDYKLSDMPQIVVDEMFRDGVGLLRKISNKRVVAFRAGAYCLQTLKSFPDYFKKYGIIIDSSVNRGRKSKTKKWAYFDYTKVPSRYCYRFTSDITRSEENGEFIEVSIPNYVSNWILTQYRLLFEKKKKSIDSWGDGTGSTGGNSLPLVKKIIEKIKSRLSVQYYCASIDGAGSDLLDIYYKEKTKGSDYMLIMGHPKCISRQSLEKLDYFLGYVEFDNLTINSFANDESSIV